MILFRWTFAAGVATATFARASIATFLQYTVPSTLTLYSAYDLSRPTIGARIADAGDTL